MALLRIVVLAMVFAGCVVPELEPGACDFAGTPEERTGCRPGWFCQPDAGCSPSDCTAGAETSCSVLGPMGSIPGTVTCTASGWGPCVRRPAVDCALQVGVCRGSSRPEGSDGGCTASDYFEHDSRFSQRELCGDGVDNDCDGFEDEFDAPDGGVELCSRQLGPCAGLLRRCGDPFSGCGPVTMNGADAGLDWRFDRCGDGVDNDCNGEVDDLISAEVVLEPEGREVALSALHERPLTPFRLAWTRPAGDGGTLRTRLLDTKLGSAQGSVATFGRYQGPEPVAPTLVHSATVDGGVDLAAWRIDPTRVGMASVTDLSTIGVETSVLTNQVLHGPLLAHFRQRAIVSWVSSRSGVTTHLLPFNPLALPGNDGGSCGPFEDCFVGFGPGDLSVGSVDGPSALIGVMALDGRADLLLLLDPTEVACSPASMGLKNVCLGPGVVVCSVTPAPSRFRFQYSGTTAWMVLTGLSTTGVPRMYVATAGNTGGDGGCLMPRQITDPAGPVNDVNVALSIRTDGGAAEPLFIYRSGSELYLQRNRSGEPPRALGTGLIAAPAVASSYAWPGLSAVVYPVASSDGGSEVRGRLLCAP